MLTLNFSRSKTVKIYDLKLSVHAVQYYYYLLKKLNIYIFLKNIYLSCIRISLGYKRIKVYIILLSF